MSARARAEIRNYLVGGVLLQILGAVAVGLSLANLASTSFLSAGGTANGGAVLGMALGWLATLAGAFCLVVAAAAKGAQIGNRTT